MLKRILTLAAACSGLLAAPVCTAFAADAGSLVRVSESVQQDIGALTANSQPNNPDDRLWYDVSRTAEVWSYSFEVLAETGSIRKAAREADGAAFLVPCGGKDGMADAVFRYDSHGILTYIAAMPLNGLQPFDPNAIAAQLSGWDISAMRLYTDPAMRFVWFESGGEEYAVVCSFLPEFYSYGSIPQGSAVKMDVFLDWVRQLPAEQNNEPSGTVYGSVSMNAEKGPGQHGLPLPAVVISAAAGVLFAYAFSQLRKNSRNHPLK